MQENPLSSRAPVTTLIAAVIVIVIVLWHVERARPLVVRSRRIVGWLRDVWGTGGKDAFTLGRTESNPSPNSKHAVTNRNHFEQPVPL